MSNAVVSIFACTQLDSGQGKRAFMASAVDANSELKGLGTALLAAAPTGYWNQDTAYVCLAGAHFWLFVAGVVWAVLFCIGFPVAMAAALYFVRRRLDDFGVNMKYGFFYDSYDAKYYFWESVILVEKLLMVLVITLLQRWSATVQVLASLMIIWVATVLQMTFRPSGCNLLHTLQRSSLFVLQVTLFLLMLSSLSEVSSRAVILVALCVAAVLNLGLVAMFLYAFGLEVRRLVMVTAGKDPSERMSAFGMEIRGMT